VSHIISENIGITSICEDSDGNIWLGSQSNGILCLSDNKNTWLTEMTGLKSNLIYILQADKNGNIWIGSNLGLDKLNSKAYHANKEIVVQHYDADDGLQELEMNLNGAIEDYEGNLWFATNNGLLKYDYRYDISNRIAPIVSLKDITIHSAKVDWLKYSDSLSNWNQLPINPVLPYNQNHITFNFVGVSFKNPKKIRYSWQLEGFDKNWVPSTSNRQVTYSNLPAGYYTFRLKSSNNDGVWNANDYQFSFTINPPFWLEWWFILISSSMFIIGLYSLYKWRVGSLKKGEIILKNMVDERTQEISLQNEELESQRDAIVNQKEQLESAHLHLSDSINYAKKIQDSILPNKDILNKKFSDSFVLFKPKDNVSGDFYWWTHIENHTIITAADCTGHGVPGAFMSMLGTSFLREIVQKEYITHTGVILRKLRKEVVKTLKQKGKSGEQKDGMDMAIISINHENNLLQFSGANNPLYIITANKRKLEGIENLDGLPGFYEIKPDKMPIAIYERMDTFKTHEIQLEEGDQVYLFSDGYPDQFGGPRGKKFKYKPFKQLLYKNAEQNMLIQNKILSKTYDDWKGYQEQIDDVVIVGIKI
jgi:serine phosphatase RsbU (regulator of sigma subunit)